VDLTGDGLLVVVPTYNEADNLSPLIEGILAATPRAHVLVVDDASPDGTGQIADSLARRYASVHVLHRSGKLGLGTAYVEGFAWAIARGYELIGEMDADHSHEPRDLPRLLRAIADGADVAVGSRNVPGGGILGWGLGRHLLSKGGSLYARLVLGAPIADLTTGFKVYRRGALEAITPSTLRSNGYAFQIETTYRALRGGARVAEVPIVFVDRRAGASKMDRRIFVEAIGGVWRMLLREGRLR
jgi:dolichol-phosphate mannosyltransferase